MNVTIHKNFNQTTPFSEAGNADEMAQIMRLRYPKACSGFERGALWFATTIEEIRRYQAWKYIGFDTFEAFCKAELGQTIHEVEEIVEGVKILGGNPTVEEAKKASKAAQIRKLAEDKPEMSRADIAREVGAARSNVTEVLRKPVKQKTVTHKTPVIGLSQNPALTAANIKAKMGEEYAVRLKGEL